VTPSDTGLERCGDDIFQLCNFKTITGSADEMHMVDKEEIKLEEQIRR
jgi:hypothetical protein